MAATREEIAGRLRVGALIGAAGVSAVGLAALVGGWWLGIDLLRQPIPAYTSIRAGTALGLVLLAVGVLAAGLSWPRWIPAATGALLASGAVAILGGYATGSPKAALESWVALHVAEDLAAPGRIAVNTAACFLLGGVGLLLLALRRADSARQGLGVAVSFVAYIAVLGYATSGFQVAGRFTAEHTEMAMQTAIPMLVAGFCLVLVDVERGWGQVIAEPLAGGRLVRAFLPLVLLLFLLAAFVYAIAVRHLQSAGETLIIAGLAVLMSVGLLFVARWLQRIDAERVSLATDIEERIAGRTLDLQQAMSLLRAQFDQSPYGLALVSPDGRCLTVNRALCELLGASREDLVGSPVDHLIMSDDRDLFRELTTGADADGERHRIDVRSAHARGSLLWLRASVGSVRDEHGEPYVRVHAFEDITAQEWARRQIADSERRYRLVADNANDAVLLVDPTGVVQWASPSVREVLGIDPENMVGTDATALVLADDMPRLQQVRRRAALGEANVPFELRMRTAHRGIRWMAGSTGPAIDADGSIAGRVTALRDVHVQVTSRDALERSERLFRLAMDGAPQGMAVVGLSLSLLQVNVSLSSMLGRDEEWLRQHTLPDLVHPDEVPRLTEELDGLIAGTTAGVVRERHWRRADGSALWMVDSIALLRDDEGDPHFFVLHAQDNTVAHRVRDELAHRANHDPLTGLLNGDQVREHLDEVLARSAEPGSVPAVLYCDLDHFKQVNDTYGHAVGDEVLKITASRIAAVVRGNDVVARLGGDEFVVVLAGVPDADAALAVAEKIRRAIRDPLPIGTESLPISISAGIALAAPGVAANHLLRSADAALYQAKRSGRDQVVLLDEASTVHAERGIRIGLERSQFVPWFQPVVRLPDRTVVGYEALVRRIDPEHGVLSPDAFLLEAERSRLVVDLDLAILGQALQWLRGAPEQVYVSVNVSGTTVTGARYAEQVAAALSDAQVDPARLHLELTESALVRVSETLRKTMAQVADLGVRWYVDDFGVGYSSIAHLRALPIAGLKLDRSFTAGLGELRGDELARAMALLADGLGLDSVAEGVETAEQAERLIGQGWRHGQGWLFGHPVADPLQADA